MAVLIYSSGGENTRFCESTESCLAAHEHFSAGYIVSTSDKTVETVFNVLC